MPELKPAYLVFLVVFVLPGIVGGVLAANRGRNAGMVALWSVLCAAFPIFLLVIYFKKPLREVEGRFRKCASCGEFIKWREPSCKYCGSALT